MKKTFITVLRTMCVGAMALFAVSCYDDSALTEGLAGLKDRVDGIEARLDSLEKNLNDNVKSLNTLAASMTQLETSLNSAIETNGAELQEALEAGLAAVQEELSAAIAAGDSAIAEALQAEKATIESALTQLQDGLAGVTGSVESLQATLTTLEAALGVKYEELLAAMDKADKVLDGKITDLNAALAEAKKLCADKDAELVESIAAAVAKIAVVDVKEADGKVVITLASGDKIEVSKPLTNVDNNGLVTIIETEGGAKYWAVLVNGEPQSLNIAVGADVNLEFRVGEDNALEFTTNGETWVPTGAYVNDSAESLFTDFFQGAEFDYDLWEEVVDPYYTLVFGGEEYYLPVYKVDNSVVTLKAGKTYFTYGETKTVEVALTDITSIYVMTKPEGWRANLAGKVLTVTAPDSAKVAGGYAEADGEVLLHCTNVEGLCKIARLAVATTPGFSLSVDEDGNITLVNPNTTVYTDSWTGMTSYDFQDAYLGLAPVAAFEKDPKAYVENAQYDYENVTFMVNVWKQNTMDWDTGEYLYGGPYVEGEYEVDVITATVEDVYSYYTYSEVPDGARFVVWACPVGDMGTPQLDDLVYGYYSAPVTARVEEVEASFTEVELSVSVFGAPTFYAGLVTEEMTYGFPIDSYMQNQEGPFGYFQMALQYGMPDYAFQQMGTLYENEGEAITITSSDLYGGALLPNTKFYMWVFPVIEGLDLADYTYEENLKPYIYEFTTSGLEAGGTLTATFGEPTLSFTNINVPVSAEGAALVYYNFYDVEEYNEIADVAADLMEYGYVSSESDFAAIANNLTPGVSRKLAVVVVDEDGLYGEVVAETFATPAITYSETFKATVGEITIEEASYYSMVTIPVTVEGGEAAMYYWYFNGTEKTEEWFKENLPLGKYPCSSGKVLSTQYAYFNSYATYQFAVVVESTTGEYSAPVIVKVNKPVSVEGEVENPAN